MPNYTKQAIMDSFFHLLDEQPLDKITVQEIITECQISRNTFYYHFGDIYSLLDALLQHGTGKLKERHQAEASWDEDLRQVIAYVLRNRRRAKHIYNSLGHGLLDQHLRQATGDLFSEYIQDMAQDLQVSSEDIQTIVYLYQSAFVGAASDWMRRGMKDSPDACLDRIRRLTQGNTRQMLENAAKKEREQNEIGGS